MLGRFPERSAVSRVSIGSRRPFMLKRVACLAAIIIGVQSQLASAQEIPLSEVLVRVIQGEVVLAGPPPGSTFPSHAAHFVPGEEQELTPFIFNQAIVSQLATYP